MRCCGPVGFFVNNYTKALRDQGSKLGGVQKRKILFEIKENTIIDSLMKGSTLTQDVL